MPRSVVRATYTRQNNQAAADLKETVSGRYGGVGLVISGAKPTGDQSKEEAGASYMCTNPRDESNRAIFSVRAGPVTSVRASIRGGKKYR